MIEIIRNKIKQYAYEEKNSLSSMSFLLALSGGMDSMVLANILLDLQNKYHFKLKFLHINHHATYLSDKIESFVSKFSYLSGIHLYKDDIFVKSGFNFESYSRLMRYNIINHLLTTMR